MFHGPAADPESLAMLRPIREQIDRDDYCVVYDADPEYRQEVCYSVGLTNKVLPELIAGVEDFADFPQGAPNLVHHLVLKLLSEGGKYSEGDVHEFHGQWVRLVPETLYKVHCNVILALYGGAFSLLPVAPCAPNPTERGSIRPICLN